MVAGPSPLCGTRTMSSLAKVASCAAAMALLVAMNRV